MRVARISVVAALLLAAAGAVRGADPAPATLDATKQELRQLQREQKNKATQPGEKLQLIAPAVGLQLQEDPGSPEAWLSEKLKKDRKLREQKATDKNWLVDGVEKLEKADAKLKDSEVAATKDSPGGNATQVIDQSDPHYLLKLFDEQKKPTDAKAPATKSAPAPDPFAPFLQSWLGSSPARGQFFDQFTKRSESSGSVGGFPAVAADYRGSGTAIPVAPALERDAPGGEKTNPYLSELNTPILSREIVNDTARLSSLGGPTIAPAPVSGGPAISPTVAPPEVQDRPKAPPSSLTDDKKYFPQLKRF